MATQVGFQLESSLASRHLTDSTFIKGGYLVVATTAIRDALPVYTQSTDGIIEEGSLCYVQEDDKFYKYNGTAWEEAEFGGGSQAYIVSTDDESGFASTEKEITITTSFTDTSGVTHLLEECQEGETIYVDEDNYPNRWIKDIYTEESVYKATLQRTDLPGGGSGTVTDVQVDGTSVVTEGVAEIDLTGKQDALTSANAGDSITITQGGATHSLPAEYQEVEYLQSTGTQWINTGVIPVLGTRFIVDAQFTSTANGRFGSYEAGHRFYFGIVNDNWACGYNAEADYDHQISLANTNRHIFEMNNTDFLIDNLSVLNYNRTSGTTTSIGLFQCVNSYSLAKLYSCKIYTNGLLVRNMMPCYRKADSVAGMYDITKTDLFVSSNYQEIIDGYYDNSGIFSTGNFGVKTYRFIEVKPNTTYTLTYNCLTTATSNFIRISEFNENKAHITRFLIGAGVHTTEYTTTITTSATTKYIALGLDDGTKADLGNITNLQLIEGTDVRSFYSNSGTGSFVVGPDVIECLLISYTNTNNYQTSSQVASAISTHNSANNAHTDIRNLINAKSTVAVSATGTSVTAVKYITINGTEYQFYYVSSFNDLSNRPSYNGTVMTNATNIPEVKTNVWDAKSTVSVASTGTSTTEAKYLTVNGTEYKLAGGSSENAVLYTAQTLTDGQKQQARTNIGASSPIMIEILEAGD